MIKSCYNLNFLRLILIPISGLAIMLAIGSTHGSAVDKNAICKDKAIVLLEKEKSNYSFTRCTQEVFNTESGQSLIQVRVVGGNISEQWEHECGYLADCKVYTGWLDEANSVVNFVNPPDVANHDPSIYTLGCGDINSSSEFDTKIKPSLVFEDNQYWWKIDYKDVRVNDVDNSNVEDHKPLCEVNGTSMIGEGEVKSSVKAKYLSINVTCELEKDSACKTAKSLQEDSAMPCEHIDSTGQKLYDYQCIRNFIAQTHDTKLCGITAEYGAKINCEQIPVIKKL